MICLHVEKTNGQVCDVVEREGVNPWYQTIAIFNVKFWAVTGSMLGLIWNTSVHLGMLIFLVLSKLAIAIILGFLAKKVVRTTYSKELYINTNSSPGFFNRNQKSINNHDELSKKKNNKICIIYIAIILKNIFF